MHIPASPRRRVGRIHRVCPREGGPRFLRSIRDSSCATLGSTVDTYSSSVWFFGGFPHFLREGGTRIRRSIFVLLSRCVHRRTMKSALSMLQLRHFTWKSEHYSLGLRADRFLSAVRALHAKSEAPEVRAGSWVAGTPGVLTPMCSATLIRCMRAVVSTKTLLLHCVRATTTTRRLVQGVATAVCDPGLVRTPAVAMSAAHVERVTGSARRRRERRLRSMLRHERMSVAMALAERLHHSACRSVPLRKELVEHVQHNAPRGQKTASGREAEFFDVFDEELGGGAAATSS